MVNEAGEKALAAAVIDNLVTDIQLYEDTCRKRWKKSQTSRKASIFRNASDAIFCTYGTNPSLALWLSYTGIPINHFRATIKRLFPKAHKDLLP